MCPICGNSHLRDLNASTVVYAPSMAVDKSGPGYPGYVASVQAPSALFSSLAALEKAEWDGISAKVDAMDELTRLCVYAHLNRLGISMVNIDLKIEAEMSKKWKESKS